jgi:hypothetical protein
MTAIADGKAVDAESASQMVEILERQHFNEAIPAGLPAGTPVAHKTGEFTKIHHDAAIVYAARPFILVILVRGLAEEKDSSALDGGYHPGALPGKPIGARGLATVRLNSLLPFGNKPLPFPPCHSCC